MISMMVHAAWRRRARAARAMVALTLTAGIWGAEAQAAAAAPTITSISPSSGSVIGGEQVTINGSGFVGRGGTCDSHYDIWFGTDLAHGYAISPPSFKVLSDSQIKAVVPANFGVPVDVRVYNACGASPITASDRFTYTYPASQCLAGTCSVAIGSSELGRLAHVGLGFLNGLNTDGGVTLTWDDGNLVKALRPRQWRLGQSGLQEAWGGEFGLARASGAQVSLDLTTDWQNWAAAGDPAYRSAPYGDLPTYYSFIHDDVERRIAAGQAPDYFDVWNEPVWSGTVNQWLSVYGTAYRAIKAADPSASVVGPSIGWFLTRSAGHPDAPGWDLSLTDVLNWEMSTGVRFAAIGYHEDAETVDAAPGSSPGPWLPTEPVPGGYRDYWSPASIATHIHAAKALLSAYPALAGTQIFVNEYGPPYAANIPGWMIGDFSALEGAGADQGMLTCTTASACNNLLDGLIGWDGAPQMPYWVMLDYSRMGGARLQSSASGSNLYALAVLAPAGDRIQALIGRADDCWGGQCPQFWTSPSPAVGVSVSVAVPWAVGAVDVTVQRLPDSATHAIGYNDVPSAPAATTIGQVAVKNGRAQVAIPAVGDGDGLYLTVTPSATSSSATARLARARAARLRARGAARRGCRRAARRASPRRAPAFRARARRCGAAR